jgi:hypothetical protein
MSRHNKLCELQKECLMLEERASNMGLDSISSDLTAVYNRLGEIITQMALGGE